MNQPNNTHHFDSMNPSTPSTPSTPRKSNGRYRPTNLIIPSVIDENHVVTVTCLTSNSSVNNSSTCHGTSMTPCESCHSSCLSGVSSPSQTPFVTSPTTLLNQHEKDFYNSMGFELIKSSVAKGITSTVNLVRRVVVEEPIVVASEPEVSSIPVSSSYSKPDQYPTSNSSSLSPDNEDSQESLYEEESTLFAEKVISLNSEHTNHSLTDIEREERCLLKCASSPYVVKLYKSTRSSKYHHRFFLEYIDGCTIADLIESRRDTMVCEKELALIAQQLLRALVFLKEKGLLHRDIKSENIMVCKNGCVKLIDLGLAIELDQANTSRVTSPHSSSTSTEPESVITKGTYSFMCPNKLLTGRESFESDLYSMGMTLLEIFLGHLPFEFDQSNTDSSFPLADIVSFDIEEYCIPLVQSGKMSYELKSLLCLCMNRDCESRATVHSLLSHPFLSHTFEMSHNELCICLKNFLTDR